VCVCVFGFCFVLEGRRTYNVQRSIIYICVIRVVILKRAGNSSMCRRIIFLNAINIKRCRIGSFFMISLLQLTNNASIKKAYYITYDLIE